VCESMSLAWKLFLPEVLPRPVLVGPGV
jgi:hypothetical protein